MISSLKLILVLLLPVVLCGSLYPHQYVASEIRIIEQALNLYKKEHGDYPREAGLRSLVENRPSYLKKIPTDIWENPYLYNYPAVIGTEEFDLYSMGINGIDDSGAVDDISNWNGLDDEYYPIERAAEDYVIIVSVLFVLGLFLLMVFWVALRAAKFLKGRFHKVADNKSINSQH